MIFLITRSNYMTYVKWDDELYWRFTDAPLEVIPMEDKLLLPSSSSKRPEIPLISERKFKEADKIVEAVEKQEDKDHKNRENQKKKVAKAKKPKKKGWFG
jgi:hypothetical protein